MGATWIVVIARPTGEVSVERYDTEDEARQAFEASRYEGHVYLAVCRAEAHR